MKGGRIYSISTRLTWMNMVVSGVAVFLACAGLFAYEVMTFRDGTVRSLGIQAEIIGLNSITALLFDDPRSAENTLAAFKASPDIRSATIYTSQGQPFATYSRAPGGPGPVALLIPNDKTEALSFGTDHITLGRRIQFQGKPVGEVAIQSDLREMQEPLKRYAVIVSCVLVISMIAALIVSGRSRRTVSRPITELAEIAHIVSVEKNYSARATPTGTRDELAALVNEFNEMLSQIQERDDALRQSQDELERRVQERTAELAAANKELEAFSYSVSHDLRAPLRHINGFASLLTQKLGTTLPPDAQQHLGRIRVAATHMGRLIDDLLRMARIGRQETNRKTVDTNTLVQNAIRELRPDCEGRQIEWKIDDLSTMECDQNLMQVVFTNLLSNSVKYTRRVEFAVIQVGQTRNGDAPVFFIRDNGAGFDQNYVHKLFGVFQRLHRSDEFEGTGVGLATVQRIIQRHGGRIWAEGKTNQGATFYFTVAPATIEMGLNETARV